MTAQTAEDEVYELRLQLAKTQVLLHEANAARHAAEQELRRLQAGRAAAGERERECISLRSMLRHALDENVRLQTQLAAAERRAAALCSTGVGPCTQQRSWCPTAAAAEAKEQQQQQPREPMGAGAVGTSIAPPASKATWGTGMPTRTPSEAEAAAAAAQPPGTNLQLLKAKLARAAAAAAEGGSSSGGSGGAGDAPPQLPAVAAGGAAHTTLSVIGAAPLEQNWHLAERGSPQHAALSHPPAPAAAAAAAPAAPQAAVPASDLQRVYDDIRALQERLKAAEARFSGGAGANASRPASPTGRLRSRSPSPPAGPEPDWRLIRELKQRKARAESAQLAATRAALAAALSAPAAGAGVFGDQTNLPAAVRHAPLDSVRPAAVAKRQQGSGSKASAVQRTPNLGRRQAGLTPSSAGRSTLWGGRRPGSAEQRGVCPTTTEPTAWGGRSARRRSRSQQEEISRLLMAGMATSDGRRASRGGGDSPASAVAGWVAPVVVGL